MFVEKNNIEKIHRESDPNRAKKKLLVRIFRLAKRYANYKYYLNCNIIHKCLPYTMISDSSLVRIIDLVKYVNKNNISGDFVECGVWRGGACMAIALTQVKCLGCTRDIWLYDTFEGMTRPTDEDGPKATNKYKDIIDGRHVDRYDQWHKENKWIYCPIEMVQKNMYSTGYDLEKINFVSGDVLKTIDKNSPSAIALLRLDTDWYESTKKELDVLFPRVSIGGIVIVDDYYAWPGSKKAADDFMIANRNKIVILENKSPQPLILKRIA